MLGKHDNTCVLMDELLFKTQKTLSNWESFDCLKEMLVIFPNLQIFLAGGVLRDLALNNGRPIRDFDLFFSGIETEKLVCFLAQKGSLKYGPFGSPRWQPSKHSQKYADIIPISGFNNGLRSCNDMFDVLSQFDFTVNAFAFNIRTSAFSSSPTVLLDQQNKIMRAVRFDYPDGPISDHCPLTRLCVLWFRLVHYAAELDLEIEPVTKEWLGNNIQYHAFKDEFCHYFFCPNLSNLFSLI